MNIKRMYLEPEEAELIRKALIQFDDIINWKIDESQQIINLSKIFLNPDKIDEIDQDLNRGIIALKKEKDEYKRLCEKLEDYLINLHIEDLTS